MEVNTLINLSEYQTRSIWLIRVGNRTGGNILSIHSLSENIYSNMHLAHTITALIDMLISVLDIVLR